MTLTEQKYVSDIIAMVSLTNDKVLYTPIEINMEYKEVNGRSLSDLTLYHTFF